MPPKKREKEGDTSKNGRIELNHLQADHELFLQAFESKYSLSLARSLAIGNYRQFFFVDYSKYILSITLELSYDMTCF